MKCTDNRCLSPVACEGFDYCRNRNKPFKVRRFVSVPHYLTQITGAVSGFRELEINASNKAAAEKMADDHPDWFKA